MKDSRGAASVAASWAAKTAAALPRTWTLSYNAPPISGQPMTTVGEYPTVWDAAAAALTRDPLLAWGDPDETGLVVGRGPSGWYVLVPGTAALPRRGGRRALAAVVTLLAALGSGGAVASSACGAPIIYTAPGQDSLCCCRTLSGGLCCGVSGSFCAVIEGCPCSGLIR